MAGRLLRVCAEPASRTETIARKITIPRFKGAINVGDLKVTLLGDGIPHCAAHSGGAAFGRVSIASKGATPYGLLFRSLAYRNAFRALNAWEWVLW